jgi:hypothetical protein
MKALQKDVNSRYQNCNILKEDLVKVRDSLERDE